MLLAQRKFSSQHFCLWAKCRFRCGEGTGFILLRLWFIVAKVSISARNDAVGQKVPGSVSENERISENICKIPSTWTWNLICNKPRSFMRRARFYNANTVLSKYYLDLQGPRWTDVVVAHMPNSSLEILNVIFHRTVAWATRNLLMLVRTRQFFLFAGSLGSEFFPKREVSDDYISLLVGDKVVLPVLVEDGSRDDRRHLSTDPIQCWRKKVRQI